MLGLLRKSAEGFVPPAGVRSNAARGLELRKKHGRGGTAVGVARARDLANGRKIPIATIGRMVSFFARHAGNQEGGEADAGYIAWLLWGGDAGKRWANGIWKREGRAKKSEAVLVTDPVWSPPAVGRTIASMALFGPVESVEPDVLELARTLAKGGTLRLQHLLLIAAGGGRPLLGGEVTRQWAVEALKKADPHYIEHTTHQAHHFIERFPTKKLRVSNHPESPAKPQLRRMPTGMIRIYANKDGEITRRQKQPDGSWRQVRSVRILPKPRGAK